MGEKLQAGVALFRTIGFYQKTTLAVLHRLDASKSRIGEKLRAGVARKNSLDFAVKRLYNKNQDYYLYYTIESVAGQYF